MEPLVHTIYCPNCAEATLAFKDGRGTSCEECGFEAEVFNERAAAFERFERFLSDADVIVTDPVRLGAARWVVAHTRMLLA